MNSLKSSNLSTLKLLAAAFLLLVVSSGRAMDHHSLNWQLWETVCQDDSKKTAELLQEGANPNIYVGNFLDMPLHQAIRMDNSSCIEALFEHGADMEVTTYLGQTPLCLAISKGKLSSIKTLIKCGAHVDKADEKGATPLHEVALVPSHTITLKGAISCIEALLERGARINATSGVGNTPLHHAAMQGREIELMQFLIEKGAEITTNNAGETPLDFLINKPRQKILEWYYNLLSCGATFLRGMENSEESAYLFPQEILEHIFSFATELPKADGKAMLRRAHNYSMACREKGNQGIECPVCLISKKELAVDQHVQTPCCKQFMCRHDMAIVRALLNPRCPLCRSREGWQ